MKPRTLAFASCWIGFAAVFAALMRGADLPHGVSYIGGAAVLAVFLGLWNLFNPLGK